jgi:hypothetical protein
MVRRPPDEDREEVPDQPSLTSRLTGEFESAEQIVHEILSGLPVPVVSALTFACGSSIPGVG